MYPAGLGPLSYVAWVTTAVRSGAPVTTSSSGAVGLSQPANAARATTVSKRLYQWLGIGLYRVASWSVGVNTVCLTASQRPAGQLAPSPKTPMMSLRKLPQMSPKGPAEPSAYSWRMRGHPARPRVLSTYQGAVTSQVT